MTTSSASTLLQLLREDLQAHGGDWSKPGFQALAVYRFGVWRMGIRPKLLRAPLSVTYRAMFRFVRNIYGIELPYSARVGRGVVIEHQGGIVVHGNCEIGDRTILRQGVTLGNRSLSRPLAAPSIGADVNIGAGAKILGDVTVGDGAVIGANAVVIHDVPAGLAVGGVPARPLTTQKPSYDGWLDDATVWPESRIAKLREERAARSAAHESGTYAFDLPQDVLPRKRGASGA